VLLGALDHQGRPRPRDAPPRHPDTILEDPAWRRVLPWCTLLGIGCARTGRATAWRLRVALVGPGWASRLVDGALGRRRAGCGGEADPALRHVTVGRGLRVHAVACWAWDPGLGLDLGQEGVGVAYGRGPTAKPRPRRRSQVRASGGTREGTSSDPSVHAIGGLHRRHRGAQPRGAGAAGEGGPRAVLPAARTGLGGSQAAARDESPGCWGRPCPRGLVAVVAPRDVDARALELGPGRRTAETRGGSRRHPTRACCHPVGIERLPSATERRIVAWCRGHAGRHEARGGMIRDESRDASARVVEHPEAVEPHRGDRLAHGAGSHGRVGWGGVSHDVPTAECVEQASDTVEVVQNWATVRGLVGHQTRLGW
jgi:hypothetical protein